MTQRPRPRVRRIAVVALAVSLAVASPVVLTGCSISGLVGAATGGKLDLGGKSVPASFPKSEVPLISGDVVYGAGISTADGKGWNVTIKVSGENSFDTINSELTGAGFTATTSSGSSSDGKTGVYAKDPYGVVVVVAKDSKNGWIANYTVTYEPPSASPSPTPSS